MFTATGLGVRKNSDNTVTIRAQVVDDRDGSVVWTRSYTAATVVAARAAILADLQALKNSETDATLTAAVVGIVLGSV